MEHQRNTTQTRRHTTLENSREEHSPLLPARLRLQITQIWPDVDGSFVFCTYSDRYVFRYRWHTDATVSARRLCCVRVCWCVCVSCLCVTGGAVVMPAARFLLPRDGHRQHCTRTCDDLTFCFACIRALFSPRPRFSICGTSSHRGLCPVFLSAATLCITSKTARSASTPSTRTRATTSKASRKQPLCT